MATTTYFGITLPNEADNDWFSALNRALARLSEVLVSAQKPAGVNLRWGDVTNGKYLETNANGVQVRGGFNTSLAPTRNFVVEGGADFPASVAVGQLFFRSDEGVLYLRLPDSWVALSAVSGEVIAAAGGVRKVDYEVPGTPGSFPVFNGLDDLVLVNPNGEAGNALVADPASPSGWAFLNGLAQVGAGAPGRGAIVAAPGAGEADFQAAPDVGDAGAFLTFDPDQALGLRWRLVQDAVGQLFGARGDLFAGSASGTGALVPGANAPMSVLVSDGDAEAGIRWAAQSELGSIPGTQTRAFADAFAADSFF